jgi:uncharacterized protein with HEPN domain
MKRAPTAFLWDICDACAAVVNFTAGADLARYEGDLLMRSAVERQLQNIGEALSQLSKIDSALAARVPRQRKLIGFRNVLVHGYAGLNDAEVWRVLHENLPTLNVAVRKILQELGQPLPP